MINKLLTQDADVALPLGGQVNPEAVIPPVVYPNFRRAYGPTDPGDRRRDLLVTSPLKSDLRTAPEQPRKGVNDSMT